MDKLKAALSFGGILTEENINRIIKHFEEKTVKANEHFLNLSNISNEIGFVSKGILRCYSIDKQGEEVTKYFIRQNQFAVDLESYYSIKPASSGIKAIADSKLFTIKKSIWEKLSREVSNLYILTKSLSEAHLLNKIKDNDFLNFGTAKDKYEEFVRRYPDLALHVPQKDIASYLKITPQSLSRIRNELVKKK